LSVRGCPQLTAAALDALAEEGVLIDGRDEQEGSEEEGFEEEGSEEEGSEEEGSEEEGSEEEE